MGVHAHAASTWVRLFDKVRFVLSHDSGSPLFRLDIAIDPAARYPKMPAGQQANLVLASIEAELCCEFVRKRDRSIRADDWRAHVRIVGTGTVPGMACTVWFTPPPALDVELEAFAAAVLAGVRKVMRLGKQRATLDLMRFQCD